MFQRGFSRVTILTAGVLVLIATFTACGAGSGSVTQISVAKQLTPQQVTVSPSVAQVSTGAALQFSVAVLPASAVSDVTWSVAGSLCTGASCGTVDINGRYVAPPQPPSPSTITITATSTFDATKSGTATVTIVPAAPQAGTFTLTANMTVPRSGHTATLLLDGRVLISGDSTSEPSAEIYDPSTGGFQPLGISISGPLVLLQSGKVLVIGSGSSQLYDPTSETLVPTGGMIAQQSVLAAALLTSGKVLVAGSVDGELYDPAQGTFAQAGTYAAAFGNISTAVVALADGRALLLGSDPPQIYDPATNSFTPTGPLSGTGLYGMDLYTATLLNNGKVLLAGGMGDWRTAAAAVYDPSSGTFSPTGSMNAARDAHAAVLLLDGHVLILGGDSWVCSGNFCSFEGSLASAELYDPASGTFSPAGQMNVARTAPAATLLKNGDVLITGGVSYCGIGCYKGTLDSSEIYHPQ